MTYSRYISILLSFVQHQHQQLTGLYKINISLSYKGFEFSSHCHIESCDMSCERYVNALRTPNERPVIVQVNPSDFHFTPSLTPEMTTVGECCYMTIMEEGETHSIICRTFFVSLGSPPSTSHWVVQHQHCTRFHNVLLDCESIHSNQMG